MNSATEIRVGCTGLDQKRTEYWKGFSILEIEERIIATAKPKTLSAWRADAPEHCSFVVGFGGAALAAGLTTQTAAESWNTTIGVCDTLDAGTILFRTPPQFRPTPANQAALIEFFGDRGDGRTIAWWAEGLWESQRAAFDRVCEKTGLIQVADPLGMDDEDELPDAPDVYWRLMGRRGLRGGFTDYELEGLVDLVVQRRRAVVVFTSREMRADAIRFGRLVRAELTDVGDGIAG